MPSINHHKLEPGVRIGKAGITDNVIKQIKDQLKKYKVVKVKLFASAIKDDKKRLAEELAAKTKSRIVHKVGFVVVLERLK